MQPRRVNNLTVLMIERGQCPGKKTSHLNNRQQAAAVQPDNRQSKQPPSRRQLGSLLPRLDNGHHDGYSLQGPARQGPRELNHIHTLTIASAITFLKHYTIPVCISCIIFYTQHPSPNSYSYPCNPQYFHSSHLFIYQASDYPDHRLLRPKKR